MALSAARAVCGRCTVWLRVHVRDLAADDTRMERHRKKRMGKRRERERRKRRRTKEGERNEEKQRDQGGGVERETTWVWERELKKERKI